MALPDRAGGLRVVYELPLAELYEVATLLQRGKDWARVNGIALFATAG